MADKGKTERLTLNQIGCRISELASNLAAQPLAQVGLLIFCISWFALKLPTDLLTAALSIMAITLTQMVLNRQNERERDAHQRDVAMHAKLDELVLANKRARDEMAGIEDLPEHKITKLKESAADAIAAKVQEARAEAELPQTRASPTRRT